MSSHFTTSQSYGFELWPPPPLVPRRKGGGEELVPAQQAYLPSITLGGFRPRNGVRKIHDCVASAILLYSLLARAYNPFRVSRNTIIPSILIENETTQSELKEHCRIVFHSKCYPPPCIIKIHIEKASMSRHPRGWFKSVYVPVIASRIFREHALSFSSVIRIRTSPISEEKLRQFRIRPGILLIAPSNRLAVPAGITDMPSIRTLHNLRAPAHQSIL